MGETTKKTAIERIREAAATEGVKLTVLPGKPGTGSATFRPGIRVPRSK